MNKKLQLLTLFLSLGIYITTFAQVIQSRHINYQGVASNASGELMANEDITVGIALKFGSSNVAADYTENHSLTTDANGVFSLQIGNGTSPTSDYNALPWYFARFVTVSINGTEIGTTELLAVPYAIRAGNGGGARKIDDLSDAKSDNNGSSLFIGVDAGSDDDGSNNNVGIGKEALFSNTTGFQNTANGHSALYKNTMGQNNTASGYGALYENITGFNNTANGFVALSVNTGQDNTASGAYALNLNTTGNSNTANGYQSLYLNTTGNSNTAVGYKALSSTTSGDNNTGIGVSASVPNATGSNQVRIGNTQITYAGVQVAWTITSDAAWKDDIQPLTYGLNMVTQLKPVDYVRKNNEANNREIGFIAQDVELLLNKLGYTNTGMLTTDDEGRLSLRYNDFIPVLTKAVQELNDKTKALEKMNKELLKRIEALENK